MPNHDGGHYFLTVLAPIRTDTTIDPITGASRSFRHLLAQTLALLPTGQQTTASPADAAPSPFAANTLNHLARFAIIDDPAFNGRNSGDALVAMVRKIDPLVPQPIDRLGTPYLLFAADVDAPGDGEVALRAYTDALWATLPRELVAIFGCCIGFQGVASAADFHAYVRRCQIETTMPFNDYWLDGLKAADAALPMAPLKAALAVAGVGIAAWVLALLLDGVFTLLHTASPFARHVAAAVAWGVWGLPVLIGAALLAIYGVYRAVLADGSRPFPTAPGSDLPTVLKSLALQQHFTRFAIRAQGLDDTALHARFGAFLAAARPAEPGPSQLPGEIRAPELASVP